MSNELNQLWVWVLIDDEGVESIAEAPGGKPMIGYAKEDMTPFPKILRDARHFEPDIVAIRLIRYDRVEFVEEVGLR